MPKTSVKSTRADSAPVALRTRLTKKDLWDLHIVWNRDQRIPTLGSRQKWAHERGIMPSTVSGWFSRRRTRHIRLAGEGAALTGSYELNPGSPSNIAPHEMVVQRRVHDPRGSDARARTTRGAIFGSERTESRLSSDDTVFSLPGGLVLDQGGTLIAVEGAVTVGDNIAGSSSIVSIELNRELALTGTPMNRGGDWEAPTSPGPAPCDCVLCVSGAIGIFPLKC